MDDLENYKIAHQKLVTNLEILGICTPHDVQYNIKPNASDEEIWVATVKIASGERFTS